MSTSVAYLVGLTAPPPLLIDEETSISLPDTRVATPMAPRKKRQAFSVPASPITTKKLRSPASKHKPLSPLAKDLDKHRYHARFATFNPRRATQMAPCPVHSYVKAEQEISVLPSTSTGGVKFGDTPRALLAPIRARCPVHAYASAEQEISVLTHKAPGGVKFGDTPRDIMQPRRPYCAVHVYQEAKSSLRETHATFAKFLPPRNPTLTSGPDVHAYTEPRSTLSSKGATPFSSKERDVHAFQQTSRALAPVHVYATPPSTLRTVGGATFGTSARTLLPSLSRTGLVPAAAPAATTAASRPPFDKLTKAAPKPLRKLALLPETDGIKSLEDGEESPRDIEAIIDLA